MIETQDLTKRYKDVVAVDRLSIRVEPGDLYGFIGPNGAGKTTTIRMLATLLKPDDGEALIDGRSIRHNPDDVRRLIGYMPDVFGVYNDMLVVEYLEFFAAAYGIAGQQRKRVIEGALELTDLGALRHKFVDQLSRGVQQRLGIARVLLHDPKVLLLDEPASGLDPRARVEVRALLSELRAMGKTVFISSHILADLEQVCNKIGIIERGRLVFSGSIREAMQRIQSGRVVLVRVAEEPDLASARLAECPAVARTECRDGTIWVHLSPQAQDISEVAAFLIRAGFRLRAFEEHGVDLEGAFMTLTKGDIS